MYIQKSINTPSIPDFLKDNANFNHSMVNLKCQ